MSVKRAQEEVSSREFAEWMAYDQTDPIGRDRGDWQAAMVACTFASVMRAPNSRPPKVEEFVLKFRPRVQPMTQGEVDKGMEAQMTAWAHAHNARPVARSTGRPR